MLLNMYERPTLPPVMSCRPTYCTEIKCYRTTSWKQNNSRSDQINTKSSPHTSWKHGVFQRNKLRKKPLFCHWWIPMEFIFRNKFGDWFWSLQEYGSPRGSASFHISGSKEVRTGKEISCQILHSCPMRNLMI